MTDFPDIDKLPPVLQWSLTIGVLLAGALSGLLGRRVKAAQPSEVTRDERDDAAREVVRLQSQLNFNELRADLEKVIRASRDSLFAAISELNDEFKHDLNEVYERLRAVENELAEIRGARRGPGRDG